MVKKLAAPFPSIKIFWGEGGVCTQAILNKINGKIRSRPPPQKNPMVPFTLVTTLETRVRLGLVTFEKTSGNVSGENLPIAGIYTLFTPQNFDKVLSSIYFGTTVKLRINWKQWLCKILEVKQSVIWIMWQCWIGHCEVARANCVKICSPDPPLPLSANIPSVDPSVRFDTKGTSLAPDVTRASSASPYLS